MKKIVGILTTIYMLTITAWSGTIVAKVNDTNIVENNSVTLTLEATGSDVKFPNIQNVGGIPVEGISNSTKSSIRTENGTTTTTSVKQMIIAFSPQKDMTIPAFEVEVDGEKLKTDPIDIKIVKATVSLPTGNEKYTLTMESNKKEVFVGEPILVSVFFNESRQADLMKVEYQKPSFKDFFVKDMGDEKTYRKGNYLVHELRYLLTPKLDGNLSIEPARAKIAERSRRRDDFFGTFFDTPSWSQIAAQPLSVIAKPLPEETDLIGSFEMSDKIDAQEVKANKPVNLTVTIKGEGNLEDFDALKYEIDGVTIYSDDAKVQSNVAGTQLISTYEKKFVFISDHNFTIPAKSFSLFNFKTGKIETLKIDEKEITVKGDDKQIVNTVQSATPTVENRVQKEAVNREIQNGDSATKNSPWMLAFAFVIGILLTLATLKLMPTINWRPKPNPTSDTEALKSLYPHINEDKEVEAMVRKLYAKKGGDKSIIIDKKILKELLAKYNFAK